MSKMNHAEGGNKKNIPLTHKEIQIELLKMMKEFDFFCRENKITYFLSHGTLIGAVRHNGFIPWDDDIDVLVPRSDYEKLIRHSRINERYDIVSYFNHGDYYHPYLYCNIADRKTVMVEHLSKRSTGKGLFIDVFPLDKCPDNPIIRKIFLLRIKVLRTLVHQHTRKYFPIGLNGTVRNVIIWVSSLFKNQDRLVRKTETLLRGYKDKETKLCGHFILNSQKANTWPSLWFKQSMECDFEGEKFSIPIGYDGVLKVSYGDYMKLPPEEERVPRHNSVEIFWK